MTSFGRIFFVTIAAGLATVAAACSDKPKEEAETSEKQGAEAACEHINAVCASAEGFRAQDCSSSNAAYVRLSASEKGQADSLVPCVMAANTCEPALDCLRPPSNSATPTPPKEPPPVVDVEAACEHINDVCTGQAGFQQQDCSGSSAAYANLSPTEKQTANAIAPCIMSAGTCESALGCLKQLRE
ncbi:MAG: hypothetical protein KF764_15410 [Labilithrix sp.]|nr:hypothetical protein [Labilithrix sp.]MBX3221020.1 hypothetical protein [Labilithrix sp.]